MAQNDLRMPMQQFGKYGYLRTPYEIVRTEAADGPGGGGPTRSSYAPSALNEAPKPWLTRGMPQGGARGGGAEARTRIVQLRAAPRAAADASRPAAGGRAAAALP